MNYYESGRTNYFRVKDMDAFTKWVNALPGTDYRASDGEGVALFFEDGVPVYRAVVTGTPGEGMNYEEVDIDLALELAEHLVPGEVAVMTASGYEGMRYMTGYAWAVNADGEKREVDIQSIYDLAEELVDDGDTDRHVGKARW